MNTAKLIDVLAARGITIALQHGKLATQSPSPIPTGIKNTPAAEEGHLLTYLTSQAAEMERNGATRNLSDPRAAIPSWRPHR